MSTAISASEVRTDATRAHHIRFSHICVPARDLEHSQRFFTEVLGGQLLEAGATTVRVHFGNLDIILGLQERGATEPDREYPHYAFTLTPELFLPLKRRLEAYGIPTHEPWTRSGFTHAIMYFRDPSGNQYEMYSDEGVPGIKLRVGHRAGGDYVVPFRQLVYQRLRDVPENPDAIPRIPLLEFNHMTIPSKDLGQDKRFFAAIFDGKVTLDLPVHVTILVGGFDVGYGGPTDGGWPNPADPYPRYGLEVPPDAMLLLKQRLTAFGIPTSEVWSSNGLDASIFFRDPSSNLWEITCPRGFVGSVRREAGAGPDFAALGYTKWNDPGR